MQRLNRKQAQQETFGLDNNRHDRKVTGPFIGKLVPRGNIVNIGGDDHVEYRVLTKPSFF